MYKVEENDCTIKTPSGSDESSADIFPEPSIEIDIGTRPECNTDNSNSGLNL